MVGEVLNIVPPVIVNECDDKELYGDVTCCRSVEDVYLQYEEWYAEVEHFAVDSHGQLMKLFAKPGGGLELRKIGEPDRPDLFRRYFLSLEFRDNPARLAEMERTLSHEDICTQVMDLAQEEAEQRENFTFGQYFKDLFRDIWLWMTKRG